MTDDIFGKWECPKCGSVQSDRKVKTEIITACKNGHVVSLMVMEDNKFWADLIKEK